MNTREPQTRDLSERERRLEEAVLSYLRAIDDGHPLAVSELLARYPDVAEELHEYLADQDRVSRLAAPLRPMPLDTAPLPGGWTPGGGTDEAAADDAEALRVALGATDRLEPLGRGGVGEVYRGEDPELGRELAVKVLRSKHRGRADLEWRFVEEARVTGRLDHPGVVPVHALGRLPDGRPYFTMKLVRGRTLAALLTERADPAHDRPRFLKAFEQICQTLAYAHSKGVIHRDLKPLNVMVGAFGEVQVMDWGFAKVLGADGSPVGGGTDGRTGPSPMQSRVGQAMGTPAYMAPEQARGEVDKLDARCDVFGLGAVLCEVLTGRPAYWGRTQEEVDRRAGAGDLGDALARLGGCGADAELVALAERCLASDPSRRPHDAGEVAEAMAAYFVGVETRLRQAERERAAAEAKAEEEANTRQVAEAKAAVERRARRLTAGLAAAGLLLFAGGGGVAWWFQQQRQTREQEAGRAVTLAANEARLLLGQAQSAPLGDLGKYREALAAARKTEDLAHTGGAAAIDRRPAESLVAEAEAELNAAQKDRLLVNRVLDVRHPPETFSGTPQSQPDADAQFTAAFREYGLDIDSLSPVETAARLRARPPAVVAEVAAALDDWAAERRKKGTPADWRRLAELAKAVDDDPRRTALRDLLASGRLDQEWRTDGVSGGDRRRLQELANKADPATEPTLSLLLLARALRAAGDDVQAERLLRAATQVRPSDVVLLTALGKLLEQLPAPRFQEAIECYTAARAVRPELGVALAHALTRANRPDQKLAVMKDLIRLQPDNPWHRVRLGEDLRSQGRYPEAEREFRAAVRLQPSDFFPARLSLGMVLMSQERFEEAEREFREAVRMVPGFGPPFTELSRALEKQGKHAEVVEAAREVIRIRPVPGSHLFLGSFFARQGRHREAEQEYREEIRLHPDSPYARQSLAACLSQQGRLAEALEEYRALTAALTRQGKRAETVTAYQAMAELQERLAAEHPAVPGHRQGLAATHNELGIVLMGQAKWPEAEVAYRKALELREGLARDYPDVPGYAVESGGSCCNLGHLIRDRGQVEAALDWYARAIARLGPLVTREPPFVPAQEFLRNSHSGRAEALGRLNRPAEAALDWNRAIALGERLTGDYPKVPEYRRVLGVHYHNLGMLLAGRGQWPEAEAAYRKAVEHRERLAQEHPGAAAYAVDLGGSCCNLGNLLRDRGEPEAALVWYARAVARLGPVVAGQPQPVLVTARLFLRNTHMGRATSLEWLGRYAEALLDWDHAIELEEGRMLNFCRLRRADCLARAGEVNRAVAEVEELPKTDGPVTYDCARVLALAAARDAPNADRHADRAVALLRQAVNQGFRDVARLQKDADLNTLRGCEDFKKLLAELTFVGPPAPGSPAPPR